MHAPCLPHTSRPPRRMAEASQEAFAFIVPTLAQRERHVFLLVAAYLEATGHSDVTGGELADWAHESILSLRPRLTGLADKGWLFQSKGMRASRVAGERRCHPYQLNVSREAVARMRVEVKR